MANRQTHETDAVAVAMEGKTPGLSITTNAFPKFVISALLAYTFTKLAGLLIVLLLCCSVTLGEYMAFLFCKNERMTRGKAELLLLLNSVTWLDPVVGMFVAGWTFGLTEVENMDKKRAILYRGVALGAIFLSSVIACLKSVALGL